MALQRIPWAVNGEGVQHSATLARQQSYATMGGQTGITSPEALKVTAGETPGPFVQVGPGSGTIVYAQGQGDLQDRAYSQAKDQLVPVRNDASAEVAINPTTSAGGRVDLICVEINDPEWEGTSDQVDYTSHAFVRFRVVQNVSSDTRFSHELSSLPRPLLPLARVAIPASTATITDSMITDVRHMAISRSDTVDLLAPANPGGGNLDIPPGNTSYQTIMSFDNISVPQWANRVKATMMITHLTPMNGRVGGTFRVLVTGENASIGSEAGNFVDGRAGLDRFQVHTAGDIPLHVTTAGSTVRVQVQIRRAGNNRPGTIRIHDFETHTSMAVGRLTFEEQPRYTVEGA